MSAEDETYDIDLYGDDEEEAIDLPAETYQPQPERQAEPTNAAPAPQGIKRKAQDVTHDDRPLDAGAQVSLKLTELQWWTTEEDLRSFCAQAKVEEELLEVAFAEHKINGKSKGDAYLEFKSPQAAGLTKRAIEKANAELEAGGKAHVNKGKIQVWYTAPGNPFKVREGQGKEKAPEKYGQRGGYNNYNNSRGNFGGRGRGGHNRGGGQWSNHSNQSNFNAAPQASFNNNAMGGFGNMPFNPMAMMMMGMPNMMAGRGGGNVMGRGGWNGGQNGQWDNNNNKKPRTE